jgi:hypothetical protein
VQPALGRRAAFPNVTAADLATPPVTVTGDRRIYSALAKMAQSDCEDLLVVDGSKERVLAVLSGSDINAIHDEELLRPPQPEPPRLGRTGLALRRLLPKRLLGNTKEKSAPDGANE